MTTTAPSRNRENRFVPLLAASQVAQISIVVANFSAQLESALGYADTRGSSAVAAKGKTRALQAGCLAVRLVYTRTGRQQSVTVVVAPGMADTVFTMAEDATYRGSPIDEVRTPLKRVLTI